MKIEAWVWQKSGRKKPFLCLVVYILVVNFSDVKLKMMLIGFKCDI